MTTLIILLVLLAIFVPIGIWQSQVRKRRMSDQTAEFQRLVAAQPAVAAAGPPLPGAASPVPVSGSAPDPTAQYATSTPDPTHQGRTPHKFHWNGLDATTSLDSEGIRFAVQNALVPFRGAVALDTTDPRRYVGEIRSWAGVRQVAFDVEISEPTDGWRAVRTTLLNFLTSQPTVMYFIPVGPKQMVGHKPYMDFVTMLASSLRTADPGAAVSIRSGPMPPMFDLGALNRVLRPPAAGAGAPVPPPAPLALPASPAPWTCVCGAADPDSVNFCVVCGTPRGAGLPSPGI